MAKRKSRHEIGSIVLVRWLDTCLQDGWRESDELMRGLEKTYSPVSTVGFLAFEDDDCLVLAAGWQTFDDSYHSAAIIPKASVVTIDKLLGADSFHDLRLGFPPEE